MQQEYDIVIVGGGLVGTALALSLANSSLSVAVVEASTEQFYLDSNDPRTFVLSLSSQRLFEKLKIWQQLESAALPIKAVHVSEKGSFGASRFLAAQEQVPALGYAIGAAYLQKTLLQSIPHQTNIYFNSELTGLVFEKNNIVKIKTPEGIKEITSKLVIGADGTHSKTRQLAGIAVKQWGEDYSSIVAQVEVSAPTGIAYERFVKQGVIAMIPAINGYKLIYTLAHETAEKLATNTEQEFITALQHQFGHRLGRLLKIGTRQLFPLQIVKAQELVRSGLVLIGNAAHTIYPLAAQGLNLGLRDVAVLAETLTQSDYDFALLATYQQQRLPDHQATIAMTENLLKLFTHSFFPVACGRKLALGSFEFLPFLKHSVARRAMG